VAVGYLEPAQRRNHHVNVDGVKPAPEYAAMSTTVQHFLDGVEHADVLALHLSHLADVPATRLVLGNHQRDEFRMVLIVVERKPNERAHRVLW